MTDSSSPDFFTKKHARLTIIARVASVFAWVILVAKIFLVIWYFIQQFIVADVGHITLIQLWQSSLDMAWFGSLIVNNLVNLLEGFVWWLVLKGIAMGLLMIVETDVNYRLSKEGGANE